jgi:8-oxo-dGTP pyrophosphatase MutT (NUDIX family)
MPKHEKRFSVIFLGNRWIPTKIVLLKRGADKKRYPSLRTGLGGIIEPGENPLHGAERELEEEAQLKIPIQEFGRVIVNHKVALHYFYGILANEILPQTPDGILEWFSIKEIATVEDVIPSTGFFLEQWANQSWSLDPFTLYIRRERTYDVMSATISLEIRRGLLE